jgi:hypothetical protein
LFSLPRFIFLFRGNDLLTRMLVRFAGFDIGLEGSVRRIKRIVRLVKRSVGASPDREELL